MLGKERRRRTRGTLDGEVFDRGVGVRERALGRMRARSGATTESNRPGPAGEALNAVDNMLRTPRRTR